MHRSSQLIYTLFLVLLLWPFILLATDNEFAWQWPLVLSEPHAGAYQVTLDASVYQAVYWHDWRDIQVVDADNQPVLSALYPASSPKQQLSSQFVDLPWFVLPTQAQAITDLNVIIKRDTDGSIITINDSNATGHTASSPSWLIDSGSYRGQLRALSVEWDDTDAIVDAGYRLEASEDLRQWQVLIPEVRLLQLHNAQEHLRHHRIAFNTPQRYLRLVPLQRNVTVPALHAVRGEVVREEMAEEATWHWLDLAAQGEHEPGGFEYRTAGRFPVQRLDLVIPANHIASWRVFSLEEEEIDDPSVRSSHWIMRHKVWHTWLINGKSALEPVDKTPPLNLGEILSSQQWRLEPIQSQTLPNTPPQLRLGWQAGKVIFLAQGRAPYTLVAGSAHSGKSPGYSTLEPMLEALRQHNDGQQWQPAMATLGEATLRAGDSAYYIAPPEPDTNKVLLKWLLWGVLISGVLIVAQLATHLLRRLPKAPTPTDDR